MIDDLSTARRLHSPNNEGIGSSMAVSVPTASLGAPLEPSAETQSSPSAPVSLSPLTSAPVPPVAGRDHVRGDATTRARRHVRGLQLPALRGRRAAAAGRRAAPVVFRHFALRARHPRAVPLAHAAEAAAPQGAFWPFHDALFADQGRIDDPHLWERCEQLGLDVDRFEADRRSRRGRRAGRRATCARACAPASRRRLPLLRPAVAVDDGNVFGFER